jgi:hypothetical protein
MLTDVLATILPMPLIWKLKLPARQRLAVMSIFGLGIFVDVAGAIRTAYVWKSMVVSYDTTWEGWPVLLAATVEINLGLVCKFIIFFFFSFLLFRNQAETNFNFSDLRLGSCITTAGEFLHPPSPRLLVSIRLQQPTSLKAII